MNLRPQNCRDHIWYFENININQEQISPLVFAGLTLVMNTFAPVGSRTKGSWKAPVTSHPNKCTIFYLEYEIYCFWYFDTNLTLLQSPVTFCLQIYGFGYAAVKKTALSNSISKFSLDELLKVHIPLMLQTSISRARQSLHQHRDIKLNLSLLFKRIMVLRWKWAKESHPNDKKNIPMNYRRRYGNKMLCHWQGW